MCWETRQRLYLFTVTGDSLLLYVLGNKATFVLFTVTGDSLLLHGLGNKATLVFVYSNR